MPDAPRYARLPATHSACEHCSRCPQGTYRWAAPRCENVRSRHRNGAARPPDRPTDRRACNPHSSPSPGNRVWRSHRLPPLLRSPLAQKRLVMPVLSDRDLLCRPSPSNAPLCHDVPPPPTVPPRLAPVVGRRLPPLPSPRRQPSGRTTTLDHYPPAPPSRPRGRYRNGKSDDPTHCTKSRRADHCCGRPHVAHCCPSPKCSFSPAPCKAGHLESRVGNDR